MYLEHWNLNLPPFENVPSPAFFYPSPMHDEALERMSYTVFQGKGTAMISGEVGCGKTTLGRILMERLSKKRYQVVDMSNPALGPVEFIQMIMELFQVPYDEGFSKAKMWQALEKKLMQNLSEGKGSVLIIDEAQVVINQETLEELRMLQNLQFDDKFLVNVILLGQIELEQEIKKCSPLDQRISIRYRLIPLPLTDAIKYIKHRLLLAGCKNIPFTKRAVQAIFGYTKGIPRQINNLCDRSLLAGYLADKELVTKGIVEAAWEDLCCNPTSAG